ncbi:hypothetical protein BCR35DRAFT_304260 [Leucosporidium creatinivorum]|uniref:Uncharacterized protein n=1 Tax=Leucosporidium creatinivorum TaxID=106004 RepID=A0A1Y2FCX4_9BASI|nr:hypothetical protein BCR35DRAFT_304260 [Leucosporidium creatinivorum]
MDSSSLPPTSQVTDNGAPFDAESLRPAISTILKGADRNSVSAKGVRKELQAFYPDLNIRAHKEEIDALVMQIFNAEDEEEEDDPSSEDKPLVNDSDSSDRKPSSSSYKIPKKEKQLSDAELAQQLAYQLNGPAKTTRGGSAGKPKASWGRKEKKVKKSRATVDSDDDSGAEEGEPKKKKKKTSGATGGGYNKPMRLSEQLSALCGGEEVLSRPQVVSRVWDHIKANELQNPKDRREIICDELMRGVMPTAKVTMFSMNKHFSKHLSPVDDGDVKPKRKAKKEESDSDSE